MIAILKARDWSALRMSEFTIKLFYIKIYLDFIEHLKIFFN